MSDDKLTLEYARPEPRARVRRPWTTTERIFASIFWALIILILGLMLAGSLSP